MRRAQTDQSLDNKQFSARDIKEMIKVYKQIMISVGRNHIIGGPFQARCEDMVFFDEDKTLQPSNERGLRLEDFCVIEGSVCFSKGAFAISMHRNCSSLQLSLLHLNPTTPPCQCEVSLYGEQNSPLRDLTHKGGVA